MCVHFYFYCFCLFSKLQSSSNVNVRKVPCSKSGNEIAAVWLGEGCVVAIRYPTLSFDLLLF